MIKPVLADSMSLILSGSAGAESHFTNRSAMVQKAVLAGNTIPVLMGFGGALALGMVVAGSGSDNQDDAAAPR